MDSAKCRLCLNGNSESIDMFCSEAVELKIIEIIAQHFWFTPKQNDTFSNLICTECWKIVETFHKFYTNVKIVEIDFLQQIKYESSTKLPTLQLVADNKSILSPEIKVESSDTDSSTAADAKQNCIEEVESNDISAPVDQQPAFKRRKSIQKRKQKEVVAKFPIVKRQKGRPKKASDHRVRADEIQCGLDGESGAKIETDNEQYRFDDERIRDFFDLKCELCANRSSTFRDVKQHYRVEHGKERGFVTCCKRKFFRRGTLLDHLSWHLNPDDFRCSICNKMYTGKFGLKLHMESSHASDADKLFSCDICQKRYVKKFALRQHLTIAHVSEEKKVHKCEQCEAKFAAKHLLQFHIRSVHEGAYQIMCEICAKIFKSKFHCDLHRKSEHSNVKQPKFQCNQCGSWLKTEISLKKHIKRHIENPETCEICGKVAPNKGALRNHIRYMHELGRKFQCNLCDKSFKTSIVLKEHIASHTGDTLYVCANCPKTFNSGANMRSHRKKMHLNEWLRDRQKRMLPDAEEYLATL